MREVSSSGNGGGHSLSHLLCTRIRLSWATAQLGPYPIPTVDSELSSPQNGRLFRDPQYRTPTYCGKIASFQRKCVTGGTSPSLK